MSQKAVTFLLAAVGTWNLTMPEWWPRLYCTIVDVMSRLPQFKGGKNECGVVVIAVSVVRLARVTVGLNAEEQLFMWPCTPVQLFYRVHRITK
jgi:hypothetical protein